MIILWVQLEAVLWVGRFLSFFWWKILNMSSSYFRQIFWQIEKSFFLLSCFRETYCFNFTNLVQFNKTIILNVRQHSGSKREKVYLMSTSNLDIVKKSFHPKKLFMLKLLLLTFLNNSNWIVKINRKMIFFVSQQMSSKMKFFFYRFFLTFKWHESRMKWFLRTRTMNAELWRARKIRFSAKKKVFILRNIILIFLLYLICAMYFWKKCF